MAHKAQMQQQQQQRLQQQQHRRPFAGRSTRRPAGRRAVAAAAAARGPDKTTTALLPVPSEYNTAMRQAQLATKAALADGHKLLEVEFPVAGLAAAQGDSDGQAEMNSTMKYLRMFLDAGWAKEDPQMAARIRVFFPDNVELAVARSGQTADPSAGRQDMAATFGDDSPYRFGYLTQQSAAWAVLGVNFGSKFSPASLTKDDDAMFVVGYPSFNPREELTSTRSLYDAAAAPSGRPLCIFNGELDRLRGGYYPAWGFPELARLTREFLPQVEAAYYIRNLKGSKPGVLFRAYPGPWQVLRRNPADPDETVVVWTSQERPSLKQVALEILPNA